MRHLKLTFQYFLVVSVLYHYAYAFRNNNRLAPPSIRDKKNGAVNLLNLFFSKNTPSYCKLNRWKYSRALETSSMYYANNDYPRIPTTTSHVFNYTNIPYQMGIRHIHALEHISDIHLLSMPFFRLRNSSFPVCIGSYTMISCDCEVLGTPKNLKMFTNKPNECQIMCFFKEDVPQLHVHLTVSPLHHSHNKNKGGHMLTMVCTYYKSPRWIHTQLKPLVNFFHFMEDTMFWSYDFREQDPNLAKYRRKVLYTVKN